MTYSFVLRLFFFLLQSTTLAWGEVLPYNYDLYGDVPLDRLWLFTLNRVYNFAQVCPKQGIQFRASLGKSGVHILCPKQGYKIEGFVLFRIRVSNLRQPNLYPNIG